MKLILVLLCKINYELTVILDRVAESPASGLDDSSFVAPSQQVVPQVSKWIIF